MTTTLESLLGALESAKEPFQFQPLYLLEGDDDFVKRRGLAAFKTRAKSEGADIEEFEAEDLDEALSSVSTLSMLGGRRLIIVTGAEKLVKDTQTRLLTYFDRPLDTNTLVVSASKFRGKSKVRAKAKELNIYYSIAGGDKRDDILSFATSEAKRFGHRLVGGSARLLFDLCGKDRAGISSAIERLSIYLDEGQDIGVDDVMTLIPASAEHSVWPLIDAISSRNQNQAMVEALKVHDSQASPFATLSLIARQMRMLFVMHQALENGASAKDAAKSAGVPPFKAQEMARSAKSFDKRRAARAFGAISRADIALKGSRVRQENILHGLVLELSK